MGGGVEVRVSVIHTDFQIKHLTNVCMMKKRYTQQRFYFFEIVTYGLASLLFMP